MSVHNEIKRLNITKLQKMKGVQKIVALTAYTYPYAQILDDYVDILLVGDSLGMVLYGYDSTLPVTVEDMIKHGECVVRGSRKAMVIIDMPFGSYQESPQQAFKNAAKILQKTGAAAIKLEGGYEMLETVKFLCERGIPVMAHIGLKPQHVNIMGGYRIQGKDSFSRDLLLKDSKLMTEAGSFALLIEGVEASVAKEITAQVAIPTIGIGAGVECDGQILVTEDMLGLNSSPPSFVKQFANIKSEIEQAASGYALSVKKGSFPEIKHSFISKS
jgi:3-methyl-2-oxobutanoate hydroxymethyltransferase